MSMQAESLEVLEKADLPSPQARAIVRAIEIELAGAKDTLATKHDLVLLRADLRQEAALLRGNLESKIGSDIGSVRGEIGSLRGELESKMGHLAGELRAEIHAGTSSIARQMYTAMLGQMAVLLGIAYFFVTRLAG